MTQQLEPPQTTDMKQSLIEQLSSADPEKVKKIFSVLSMLIRAFEGKDLSDKDVITRLINLQSKMERSRLPTMAIVNFQVYCRLVAQYHPELSCFEDWANLQAEALIAYQGLNWEAYIDMVQAQYGNPPQAQTAITFAGAQAQAREQQQKKTHWWSRKPKQETEFKKD